MGFLGYFEIAGEILAEAWALYRKCFWRLLLICLVCNLPSMAYNIAFYGNTKPSMMQILVLLLLFIPMNVGAIIYLGASARLLEMTRKEESAPWLAQCILFGWRRFFMLLGTYFLFVIAIMVPAFIVAFIILFGIFIVGLADLPNYLAAIIAIGLLTPFICAVAWAAIRLSLSTFTCFFEGWNPIRAIIRSFVLTSGNFWVLFIAFAAVILPLSVLSVLANYFAHFYGYLLGMIVGLFAGPYFGTVMYRAYIRLSGEESA